MSPSKKNPLSKGPLGVWRTKGWIHEDDPRGWFQWYCRYHQGRRISGEDERQIGRWRAMRRHVAQLRRACEPGEVCAVPKVRTTYKVIFWAVAALVLVALAFPYVLPLFY